MKKLLYSIKPPCPKCPFTLGLVQFVKNPCSECRMNGYRMYDELIKKKGGGDYSGSDK